MPMKKVLPFILLIILVQSFFEPTLAQSIDKDFNPVVSTYGSVNFLRKYGNDKILMMGHYTHINGEAKKSIVLLNQDGSIDNTFVAPDFNGHIYDILILPDLKVLVAGDFTTVNGLPHKYLVKLNSNGSIDETFENSGPDGMVLRALLQPVSGKIVLFGFFVRIKDLLTKL